MPITVRGDRVIGDRAVRAVREAIEAARGDWSQISALAGTGPVEALEQAFCDYLGVRHALALSSGTAAIHAALVACGVGPGDEVVAPTYTWGQSVAPVLHLGAVPVFVDIEPTSLTIDPGQVETAISSRTKAIIAVHLFGHPAAMDALRSIAATAGIALIEDAAQALGARLDGRLVGGLGDCGCFSLGRGKIVSGGEGGVLVTNRTDVYERAVAATQHPLRQIYELGAARRRESELSHNFRIHPLAAVIARAEMADLDERLDARRRGFLGLFPRLENRAGIRVPVIPTNVGHAFYRLPISFVPNECGHGTASRDDIVELLNAEGLRVGTDPIAVPLHRRIQVGSNRAFECPVADRRCSETGLVVSGLG